MSATNPFDAIESQFAVATPPRAGSTSWYDACDQLATAVKDGLRARFGRGFHTEVYGDEVGLILRVRGDGCGARPWSVDRALDPGLPLGPQVESAIEDVSEHVRAAYV